MIDININDSEIWSQNPDTKDWEPISKEDLNRILLSAQRFVIKKERLEKLQKIHEKKS